MSDNYILVKKDGPLLCTGDVAVYSADGDLLERSDDVALCRCGASATKPFCDGSHKRVGFTAPGTVVDDKAEALDKDAPLTCSVRPNAMMVIKGPVTIEGADSGSTTRNRAALCRCGHSQNKPFCDASHKTCGFSDD